MCVLLLQYIMPIVDVHRLPYKQQVEEQSERIRSLTAERDSLKIEVQHSKVMIHLLCKDISAHYSTEAGGVM